MIQFVLASHGNYAKEALNSAKMICGEDVGRIHLLSVQDGGDGIAHFGDQASELARSLIGSKVLILADLFGGGPFMTLLSSFRDNDYKCLTGFNLPMVIEMLQADGEDLDETADMLCQIGKDVSIRLIDKIVVEEDHNDQGI